MAKRDKIFAGAILRDIRDRLGLTQAALARRLGVSVSYLSQLESDSRPLTIPILLSLSRDFGLDLDSLETHDTARLAALLREALGDPMFAADPAGVQEIKRTVTQAPSLARRFVDLHRAYRQQIDRIQTLDDAIGGQRSESMVLPWDEVRDYFQHCDNYIDALDAAAEALTAGLAERHGSTSRALEQMLEERFGIRVAFRPASGGGAVMRHYDAAARVLWLAPGVPQATRAFLVAHQLALSAFADALDEMTGNAALVSDDARKLLRVGLANYAAGALLMPYALFAEAALAERHDVERLAHRFGTSFEQVCHRLSTLQRPGARGVPFFFVRVDMAGNITKRHSATRLQFARYGGTCPLWNVHEAVAAPGRILVQLVETPDGVRYVSMAMGLVKPSGSYGEPDRRFAVALGCEASFASQFVYADGLSPDTARPTPIASSCRICPRPDCTQRAFPPVDRRMTVDPDSRKVVPYGFV